MILKIKYLFAELMMLFVAGCVISCDNKKEQTEIDQWMANYVYIERPSLGLDVKEFTITHSGAGIGGNTNVWLPIAVRLLKPWASDVTVKLSYTVDVLPDSLVSLLGGGTVVIPAGELVARDTLKVDTDWRFVPKPKTIYKATVGIESIEPVSGELRKSSKQSETGVLVTKTAFLNMSSSTSSTSVPGTLVPNRSTTWTVVLAPNVENADNPGRLIDGSTGTDIASSTLPYWLTIDLAQTTTINGFRVRAWGSTYAPRGFEIFTSDDGFTWESQGQLLNVAGASTLYIRFLTPVTCRHIKYDILTAASIGRTSLTEFDIYEQL